MEEFYAKKGLRQEDPLAPFLFLMVVEGLSGLIREGEEKGLFSGVGVSDGALKVSLLQFANDTIFFYKEDMSTLKVILRCSWHPG